MSTLNQETITHPDFGHIYLQSGGKLSWDHWIVHPEDKARLPEIIEYGKLGMLPPIDIRTEQIILKNFEWNGEIIRHIVDGEDYEPSENNSVYDSYFGRIEYLFLQNAENNNEVEVQVFYARKSAPCYVFFPEFYDKSVFRDKLKEHLTQIVETDLRGVSTEGAHEEDIVIEEDAYSDTCSSTEEYITDDEDDFVSDEDDEDYYDSN